MSPKRPLTIDDGSCNRPGQLHQIRLFPVLRLLLATLLAAAIWHAPAAAQQVPTAAVPQIVADQQKVIQDLSTLANELERRVEANRDDDARLVDLRLELEALARQLLQAGVAFRPRLGEINTRLELLGPAPAEGQPPESDLVRNERNALASEKSQINVLIGEAETASLRVNRLVDQIAEMRRELFANTLSKRYDIDFALLGEVVQELRSEM